jgi:predicted small secreted protein
MKRMLFPVAVLLTAGLLLACGGSMSPLRVVLR